LSGLKEEVLKLTAKGRYAVRAMLFLAENEREGPLTLNRIASCGLPRDYLEQLLGQLRRAGLLETARGTQGGYYLSKPALDISMGDIISAVEGPVVLSECAADSACCEDSVECRLRGAWETLTSGINELMGSMTLNDLLKQDKSMQIREA
jgi:Rrf2 family cysteine metabolism transcriptional repressor